MRKLLGAIAFLFHRAKDALEGEFRRLAFEPYAPVRAQMHCLLREVNRRRALAQYEPISGSCITDQEHVAWRRRWPPFCAVEPAFVNQWVVRELFGSSGRTRTYSALVNRLNALPSSYMSKPGLFRYTRGFCAGQQADLAERAVPTMPCRHRTRRSRRSRQPRVDQRAEGRYRRGGVITCRIVREQELWGET